MTNPTTLNAIASEVVSHYGHAAKSLVAAGRSASKRALRIVAAERRVAGVVGAGVERIADGYDRGIELVSGRALKGLGTVAQRTHWAKDMFVVDTLRRINLPLAKLSLKVAGRIDDASSAISARAKGTVKKSVVKRAVKKATGTKRVRRAA